MTERDLVLIGYFAKRVAPVPGSFAALGVTELCSVSECLAEGPHGWIDAWRHNEFFLFNNAADAWSFVPGAEHCQFRVFAYRMLPALFDNGRREPFPLPELRVQPVDGDFERLGYDVVSRSCGTSFECSPLSCNSLAEGVAVNRYCLLDNLAAAVDLATFRSTIAARCEPGPYAVVEVWRRSAAPNQAFSAAAIPPPRSAS